MKNREAVVATTNRKLDQLNEEHEELRDKTNKLEKECQKSQTEYKNVCDNLDSTIGKNKELTNKLKGLEQNLRTTESNLDSSILKRESLRKEHMDLVSENKLLNSEIDKTLLSILEYEKINKELQKEVENYIECDEEARSMLNRKEAMRNLLDEVSSKLHKTEEQIAHLR